jgi:hypothetical protein
MAVDYWKNCETGLLNLLRSELSSLFPHGADQVTASDDTVLDNGNDFYAISYPGAFPQTEEAAGFIEYSWEILLEVVSRWNQSESKAWNESGFKALRSEVIYLINHTEKGRTLGKTNFIRGAVISADDRPNYIPVRGSDPASAIFSHIRQVCIVTVRQIVPRE